MVGRSRSPEERRSGRSSPAEATAGREALECGVACRFEVSDEARWKEKGVCAVMGTDLMASGLWWRPELLEQRGCDFPSVESRTLTALPLYLHDKQAQFSCWAITGQPRVD